MEFDIEFRAAFDHAMIYEVGPFWDPTDPDVINGLIMTRDQRRKVGYVNDKFDRGGETKYGIAKNANPNVSVGTLNLKQAMGIYFDRYWKAGCCDILSYPLNYLHFDGCVNHGVGRACKFLQAACGIPPQGQDGIIGPKTLAILDKKDGYKLGVSICEQRTRFYKAIVANNPGQGRFLNGWLRRINEMRAYIDQNRYRDQNV